MTVKVTVEFDLDASVIAEGPLTVLVRGTVRADGVMRVGHVEVVKPGANASGQQTGGGQG